MLWQGAANAQIHRVALVVQHGPDWPGTGLIYKCVEFAQNAISGLELLELAGVNSGQPPAVYDWGGGSYSICQVDHEPRSVPDRCFGPTSGRNWSDWHQTSSGWVARSTGTSGYALGDGDVEAWSYSAGYGAPPRAISFSQVCRPANQTTTQSYPPAVSTAAVASPTPSSAASSVAAKPTTTLEAIAPSLSPPSKAALARTGPISRPAPPPPTITWLAMLGVAALLAGLGVLNLLRRKR